MDTTISTKEIRTMDTTISTKEIRTKDTTTKIEEMDAEEDPTKIISKPKTKEMAEEGTRGTNRGH